MPTPAIPNHRQSCLDLIGEDETLFFADGHDDANRRRRHSTLGYASPQQFLNDWIRRQHGQKLAA
jgi:hypothetical protein